MAENLLQLLNNKELTKEDIIKWKNNFEEVQAYLKSLNLKETLEEQIDLILSKMHNNNAYCICSDTSFEPIEYIDFNFGSITGTISTFDRDIAELVDEFEGYIIRNGEELEGVFDVSYEDICNVLKEI